MPTLEELLDHAVPQTTPATDFDVLAARGTRRRHVKRGGGALLAIVAVLVGAWAALPQQESPRIDPVSPTSQGLWEAMAPSPLGPRVEMQTAIDGERILYWGGRGPLEDGESWQEDDRLDGAIYDANRDSWRLIPPTPDQADWVVRLDLTDEHVILIGAESRRAQTDASWAFDLTTETWNRLEDPPFDMREATWLTHGGAPLVLADDGTVAQLDPWSGTWSLLPSLPDPVEWSGVELGDDYLLVFGGTRDTEKPLEDGDLVSDGWLLDLRAEAWRHVASPLTGRVHPDIAWLDGRFLVLGGSGPDVEGWEATSYASELPGQENCDGGQCSRSSGAVIGIDPGNPPVSRLDGAWFDPATNEWATFDPAAWFGRDVEPYDSVWLETLDDSLAYLNVSRESSGDNVIYDAATGRHWEFDFPGALGNGFELVEDAVVGMPYLLMPLRDDEERHPHDGPDTVVFRELELGTLSGMAVAPPGAWGEMNVAAVDGRIVLWGGRRHAPEGNGITWLDGGWVLDLRNERYALDR